MFPKLIKRLEENDPTLTELRFKIHGLDPWKGLGDSYRKKFGHLGYYSLFDALNADCIGKIGRILRRGTNNHLRVLDLEANTIQKVSDIAQMLRVNTSLVELRLSSSLIGSESVKAMTRALEANPETRLRVFNLGQSSIGYEGGRAIAQLLKINTSLRELYLGSNKIGDIAASAIAESLKINASLRNLNLSSNGIRNEGAHIPIPLQDANNGDCRI